MTLLYEAALFFLLITIPSWAQEGEVKPTAKTVAKEESFLVLYFNQEFGHVHNAMAKSSDSLTTLGCGHPVKILKSKIPLSDGWKRVKVGLHEGYIHQQFLDEKRPSCFQGRYPKFFGALNLDLTQLYYWGRLSDQYVYGKTQVGQGKE